MINEFITIGCFSPHINVIFFTLTRIIFSSDADEIFRVWN